MELVDLSLIKPMLMRSLENPEAIKVFINEVVFMEIFGIAIGIIIVTLVIHYIYSLVYSLIKSRKNDKKDTNTINNTPNPFSFNNIFCEKIKNNLGKYRHFLRGVLLLILSWLIVCLLIWLLNIGGTSCDFSTEENYVLSMRPEYSELIFLIASMLIMFSFGNKFVRNLGIFTFILCILFILMGKFISLGCVGM